MSYRVRYVIEIGEFELPASSELLAPGIVRTPGNNNYADDIVVAAMAKDQDGNIQQMALISTEEHEKKSVPALKTLMMLRTAIDDCLETHYPDDGAMAMLEQLKSRVEDRFGTSFPGILKAVMGGVVSGTATPGESKCEVVSKLWTSGPMVWLYLAYNAKLNKLSVLGLGDNEAELDIHARKALETNLPDSVPGKFEFREGFMPRIADWLAENDLVGAEATKLLNSLHNGLHDIMDEEGKKHRQTAP